MITIGVAGVGHLGRIHVSQIVQIESLQLGGIYDTDRQRAEEVAREFGCPIFASYEELLAQCEAVDLITPTITHFELAKKALQHTRHLFVEKPLCTTADEARALVSLAQEAEVVVQVGHVERFNPALLALESTSFPLRPLFIESHRLAPWNPRGTDVSVVLDLMIHDLDIVLALVKSEVWRVSANGVSVISSTPDICNARIEFNNGCVANLTASRISMKRMRKMRIFQPDAYVTVDFLEKRSEIYSLHSSEEASPDHPPLFTFEVEGKKKYLHVESPPVPEVNAIRRELETFAEAITTRREPPVTLLDAYASLSVAQEIMQKIHPTA